MTFTKVLSLVCVVSILSACSALPTVGSKSKTGVDDAASTVAADTTAEQAGKTAVVLSPNPYLQNRQAVPKAAQVQFQQALAAMRQQQWAQAEPLLQELTVNYPTLSGPWLNLGLLNRQMNKPEQAIEALKQAVFVNPNNIDAYNQLALVLREQGRFSDAEQQYLQAIKVWPDHADSHRNLGILYELYMGKLPEALVQYERTQALLGTEDRQLTGWVIDVQRRIAAGEGK